MISKVSRTALLAIFLTALACVTLNVSSYAQNTSASVSQQVFSPVNINKASVEDLETINGIGLVLAERIVEYRKNNGAFEVLEDLMDVPGIGQAKYERIKGQITL